jgi:hypothetical protein
MVGSYFRPRAGAAPLKRLQKLRVHHGDFDFRPRAGAAPLKHLLRHRFHHIFLISAPARGRLR